MTNAVQNTATPISSNALSVMKLAKGCRGLITIRATIRTPLDIAIAKIQSGNLTGINYAGATARTITLTGLTLKLMPGIVPSYCPKGAILDSEGSGGAATVVNP